MSPRGAWRTGPNDTWNARHGIRCPGCRLGEFWGIPRHEKACRVGTSWYATPDGAPAWALKLLDDLDDGPPAKSPAEWEDRRRLLGMNWLSHALWHNASTIDVGRVDTR